MTPLPASLGGTELVGWRLDNAQHASSWDSGEGSYRAGRRWNSKGVRAVYCALDPSTAILEIAVHTGFEVLDIVPHILTAFNVIDLNSVHVVEPSAIPDPAWLRPGTPTSGQQAFGTNLLTHHKFILIPSAVSPHSWNLIFTPAAAGAYSLRSQENFALDPRLQVSRH